MRGLAKHSLEFCFRLVLLPLLGVAYFSRFWNGYDRSVANASQLLSLIPGVLGVTCRRAFYRSVFQYCGDDVCVSFGSVFSGAGSQLGNRVYLGLFCSLGDVCLEDDVLVASHVSIMNGFQQHGIEYSDRPIREQPGTAKSITIGRGAWIGERAVVGASVGEHSVVAAGAVVVKPVPPYAIVAGVPAKVIRYRNTEGNSSTKPPQAE